MSIRKWRINKANEDKVKEFAAKCDLPALALQVLSSRGYNDFQQIVDFFSEAELEEPFALKDMDKAVDEINHAVDNGDLICIYGDYDCDGITATSILYNYLYISLGANVMYYIPDRADGYGMNIKAVDILADQGVQLIITVDNGISAIEEARRIHERGMRLVITDHHQVGEILPESEACVDPHRKDCPSRFKDICGAFVALKLCAALECGDYEQVLEQYGDVCAIGTIGDVMPLRDENRTIVKYGLRTLPNTEYIGLADLLDKRKLTGRITSTDVAFRIVPVINASGRLGSAVTAVKALTSEEEEKAESYVDTMIAYNDERRTIEFSIMQDIVRSINNDPSVLNQRVLVVSGKGWHHGVVGIVASRLVESFGKPVMVVSIQDGEARGSARSVEGFNIFDCLTQCREPLTKFGGHEGAGGFSMPEEKLEQFRSLVYEYANGLDKAPIDVLEVDKLLLPEDLKIEGIKGLSRLEPLGEGNEKPVFAILGARVDEIMPLSGGKHTKFAFTYGGVKARALMFGRETSKLNFSKGDKVDMLVTLDVDVFQEKEQINIKVTDLRISGVKQEKYFAAKDTYERLMRGESLPVNYVRKIIPERHELVTVYKAIAAFKNITIDDLFARLGDDKINFCKLHICTDIFRDKGLIDFTPVSGRIKLLPIKGKVELDNSETLVKLNKMLERRE